MSLEQPRLETRVVNSLTLVPEDLSQAGGTFPPSKSVLVGTNPICELYSAHSSLSQRHALFACHPDGRWWVYDLHSRRGVRVNERTVSSHVVRDGDEIELGDLAWRVRINDDREPRTRRPRGKVFGEFLLVDLIHSGQKGKLYRGFWKRKRRQVAVRIFPPGFASERALIRKLKERLPQSAKIHHDNIVRLYCGGRYKDGKQRKRWYLVSEYMVGGSLRDRLAERTQPLPVADVVKFALDIASGLRAAWEVGVRHRNVNPSCIFFNADGCAKLGDFIHARPDSAESTDMTRMDRSTGELVYNSPERIRGHSELTPAADLYSLAVCMYEALTLRPPFAAAAEQGVIELVRAIREERPPSPREFNSDIPPRLANLILDTLAKPAERRPQGADEFLERLAKSIERA